MSDSNKLFFAAPILLTTVGWAQPADRCYAFAQRIFIPEGCSSGWNRRGEVRAARGTECVEPAS